MKHTLLLLACLFTFTLSAQGDAATGMAFVEKSFDDLLAQAKAEDKVIFIDAYTTWCGPCKMMAKNVFPAEEVGKVYNERFINAKFDMEKGEGPDLARRYSVQAYPTYLFVDGNGDIVHKGIGYIPQSAFLELADAATGENSLGALNKRYEAGERSNEFLASYASTLGDVYEEEKAAMVMDQYLKQVKDWSSPATLEMLLNSPGEPGGKRMNYLVANADAAMAASSDARFMMTMQQAIVGEYMKVNKVRVLPEVAKIEPLYEAYAAPLKHRLGAHYKVLKARQSRDTDAYIAAALPYYAKYPSTDAMELNSLAWDIYETSDDPQVIRKGLELAKRSVELDPMYMNLDTLAWLYEKSGDHKNAVITAKKAIKMAKESDEDYESTEKILKM